MSGRRMFLKQAGAIAAVSCSRISLADPRATCGTTDVPPARDFGWNFLDWICGCVMIYSALFGIGKIILKEMGMGFGFIAAAVVAGIVIYWDLWRRGWSTGTRPSSRSAVSKAERIRASLIEALDGALVTRKCSP